MKKILNFMFTKMFKLIKINEKKIVLESNPTLQDNTGALFRRMIDLDLTNNYEVTWLVYDDFDDFDLYPQCRFIVLNRTSRVGKIIDLIKANIEVSQAKLYLFSHRKQIIFTPKKHQRIVNLTHGIPIKDSSNRHSSQENVTDIVTLSSYSGKLRMKTYDSGSNKLRILGYPRNDLLLNSTYLPNGKYFVWLPTYRTHKSMLGDSDFDHFPLNPKISDFKSLNDSLKNMDRILYIKPHPAQTLDFKEVDFSNIIILDNYFFTKNKIHLYEFLGHSDALITDYSSVYLDFLLVNKPIIFTFDDFEEYSVDWGFTVENIFDVTPGKKIYNMNDLADALEDIYNGIDDYEEDRIKVTKLFHKFTDSSSSDRILKYLNLIDENKPTSLV